MATISAGASGSPRVLDAVDAASSDSASAVSPAADAAPGSGASRKRGAASQTPIASAGTRTRIAPAAVDPAVADIIGADGNVLCIYVGCAMPLRLAPFVLIPSRMSVAQSRRFAETYPVAPHIASSEDEALFDELQASGAVQPVISMSLQGPYRSCRLPEGCSHVRFLTRLP